MNEQDKTRLRTWKMHVRLKHIRSAKNGKMYPAYYIGVPVDVAEILQLKHRQKVLLSVIDKNGEPHLDILPIEDKKDEKQGDKHD